MALFTLSDLHLSFSVEKPMDVFGCQWNHFEEKLKEYWEYLVREEDTVVIPGDISWGMTLQEAAEDLRFIHRLPGTKILMKGNHDYWWSSLQKLSLFREEEGLDSLLFLQNDAYLAQGKIICGSRGWMCEDKMTEQDEKILRREAIRFEISLQKAERLAEEQVAQGNARPECVVFSHYPVVSATLRENPILDVLKRYRVKRVYYGHLHNWGTKPLYESESGIEFTLVSSDYRNFTPVRID